ncbi:MAG TPA: hypothetical protein VGQ80_02205 [Acidimicrobiia bacterium]|nr:hypothetical protein [Acidimicrobiia bacterium]
MTAIPLRRAALVVLSVVLLAAAGCSKGNKDATTTTTLAPTTAPTESTTTTVPMAKESIVLAPDGLGASLPFGTNSASTIKLLMQALGQPEKNTPLPAGQACGATRRLTWANFQALVNEVVSSSGAGRPGFAGWFLGPAGPNALPFKTEKGSITVGSTVAALKAAYGADVAVQRGEQGYGFTITLLPKGLILGQVDGQTDASKVKNIQAGNYCGPA